MRRELRKQIELLEQKMSKSPNNMKDGGSHFLYRRERLKYCREICRKKCLQKTEPNRKLHIKTHHRRTI